MAWLAKPQHVTGRGYMLTLGSGALGRGFLGRRDLGRGVLGRGVPGQRISRQTGSGQRVSWAEGPRQESV
jgi:hypothetical protein